MRALVIVGHGSHLNEDSSLPVYEHAGRIRETGEFDEVVECFWKEEPSMRHVLDTVEWVSTDGVFRASAHPYTAGLLQSARVVRDAAGRFPTIGGDVPNLAQPIEGCPFRPRCAFAFAPCTEMPAPVAVPGDRAHAVRCWYFEERLRSAAETARAG